MRNHGDQRNAIVQQRELLRTLTSQKLFLTRAERAVVIGFCCLEETLLARLSGIYGTPDWIRVTLIGSIVGRAKPIQVVAD